jgi:hypothetical protein
MKVPKLNDRLCKGALDATKKKNLINLMCLA